MTTTTRNPGLYFFRGTILVLLGVLALLMPGITFATLVILFAAHMLVDGIFYIIRAIKNRKTSRNWGWYLAIGIISIIAGIVAFINPFAAGTALVFLFGFWIMLAGVTAITAAIRLRKAIRGEGWYIAAGIISVIFSLLILLNPAAGAISLAVFFGINALTNGILLIVLGIRLKQRNKHPEVIANTALV